MKTCQIIMPTTDDLSLSLEQVVTDNLDWGQHISEISSMMMRRKSDETSWKLFSNSHNFFEG